MILKLMRNSTFIVLQVVVHRDFLPCHLFYSVRVCISHYYVLLLDYDSSRMSKVYYNRKERIARGSGSGDGKYIRGWLKREREGHHHRRYLQRNPESTRHRYSPERL